MMSNSNNIISRRFSKDFLVGSFRSVTQKQQQQKMMIRQYSYGSSRIVTKTYKKLSSSFQINKFSKNWFNNNISRTIRFSTTKAGGVKKNISTTMSSSSSSSQNSSSSTVLNTFMKRSPFAAGVLVATIKTGFADVATQLLTLDNPLTDYDYRRTGLFVLFGFFYMGIANHLFYYEGFTRLFPYMTKMTSTASFQQKIRDPRFMKEITIMNLLDNFAINPIFYWPIFYNFKALCFTTSKSADDNKHRSNSEIISSVFTNYRSTFINDNFSMAFFWIPANYFIYSIPIHLRLPANHVISFTWSFILSYVWGGSGNNKKITEGGESSVDNNKKREE